jgi:hypothetical protein
MQYGFLAKGIGLTGMVDIKIKQDDKMKLTSCTLATSSWAKSSKTFYGLFFANLRNKLDCLSLAGLFRLV